MLPHNPAGAAQTAAREAREKVQAEPEDAALTAPRSAEQPKQSKPRWNNAPRRVEVQGKSAADLSIRPVEPEAVVQPQKNKKVFAPSYQPSVLAN